MNDMNDLNDTSREFTQLNSSSINEIKSELLILQDGKCAICGCVLTEQTGIHLDHQHMTSKESIGESGAGLIRGVCCRSCNVMEGKIWNNLKRYKQTTSTGQRVEWLGNLIKYYEKGTYNYIHPSEKPKEPQVSKRYYNKLKKLYNEKYSGISRKKKFPEYPKSGKLTNHLKKLFAEFELPPYN